jgi:hypothetical protein
MKEFANLTQEELIAKLEEVNSARELAESEVDKAKKAYQNQKIRAEKAESAVSPKNNDPVDLESIITQAIATQLDEKLKVVDAVVEDIQSQKEASMLAQKRAEYISMGINVDVVNELIKDSKSEIPQIVVEKFATKVKKSPEIQEDTKEEQKEASLFDVLEKEI